MTKDRQSRKTGPKPVNAATAPVSARRPIVSSAHLAANSMAELSEFEFALMMANNAFNRWVVRCMNAAGTGDLAALDVLVLHSINHRDRAKRLADICLVLNIEDSHTVNYAVKKLVRTGLVQGEKRGKSDTRDHGNTPSAGVGFGDRGAASLGTAHAVAEDGRAARRHPQGSIGNTSRHQHGGLRKKDGPAHRGMPARYGVRTARERPA